MISNMVYFEGTLSLKLVWKNCIIIHKYDQNYFLLRWLFCCLISSNTDKEFKDQIDKYVRVRRIRSNGGMGNWNPIFGGINLNIEEYSVDFATYGISDYNYR